MFVGLGASTGQDAAFWRGQLHALAVSIFQATGRMQAALSRGDRDGVTAEASNLENLRAAFAHVRQEFLAAMEAADPTLAPSTSTLSDRLGDLLQAYRSWVYGLPNQLAGFLAVVVEAAGDVVRKTGTELGFALLPLAVIALGLIFLTQRAERTRTYRRYVA